MSIKQQARQKVANLNKKSTADFGKLKSQISAQRGKDFKALSDGMTKAKPTTTSDDVMGTMQGQYDVQNKKKEAQMDNIMSKFKSQEVKLFEQKDARGFEDASKVEKDKVPEPPNIKDMISKGVIGLFKG